MVSDWKTQKLDELIVKRNQGVNTTTEKVKYSESGKPVIRANSISQSRIDFSDCVFVDDVTFQRIKEPCKPKKGDVLYTNIGSQFGSAAKVESDFEFTIAWNVLRLQVSKDLDADFLVYLLNNPKNKALIQSLNSSSTMPFVSGTVIGNIEFLYPDYETQKRIVAKLKPLDAKIDLSRGINQTLEKMAQVLFKSWFVDFDPVIDNALAAGNAIPDELQERAKLRKIVIAQRATNPKLKPLPDNIQQLFPSEFKESELGWIPKGWQIKTIDTLNKINPESWTNKTAPESVKYVDLANAKYGAVLDTTEFTFSEAPSRARRVLKIHDTIIGVVRPANRSFAYINEEGLTGSTGFAVVRAKKESYRAFTYFSLTNDDCIREFARIADGAAYPAIKPDDVAKALCVYSSEQILSQFENLAGQFLLKKSKNEQQLQPLKTIRDTLLPKLISGEVII